MALEIITDFRILMQYAKALGDVERRGNPNEIIEALGKHDAYKELCLTSDKTNLGVRCGSLL